jgi:hypothetical protein
MNRASKVRLCPSCVQAEDRPPVKVLIVYSKCLARTLALTTATHTHARTHKLTHTCPRIPLPHVQTSWDAAEMHTCASVRAHVGTQRA